ncbi:MAG: hypothetical protein EOP50_00885 [Sphingobacteriales bacterium]|nr:MAG: hypothetical protein EOP50_00885 [Sphingobacteriales bacterium]
MASFDVSYKFTAQIESGYALLSDGAGYTYCGITYKNFPTWEGWKYILPLARAGKIKAGTIFASGPLPGLVKAFYEKEFWQKMVNGRLIENQDIANMVYDWCVNSQYAAVDRSSTKAVDSINEAAAAIQRSGTIKASKYSLTPEIISVLNEKQPECYRAIFGGRKAFYDSLRSSRPQFYDGWMNRLNSFPRDTVSTRRPAPVPAAPVPKPAAPAQKPWYYFLNPFNW